MARTTKKAEKDALHKQRRRVRRKLRAKQRARYSARKGQPGKHKRKSHPHRSTSTKRRHAA